MKKSSQRGWIRYCSTITFADLSRIMRGSSCLLIQYTHIYFLGHRKYGSVLSPPSVIQPSQPESVPTCNPIRSISAWSNRMWKFVKKKCLYSKYYKKFPAFKTAILKCLDETMTTLKSDLDSLLTLRFQFFQKTQFVTVQGIYNDCSKLNQTD
jgi:hypothetical protein